MVRSSLRQGEEEDLQGPGPDHPGQEAQDVQLPGVAGPQDCLQEVSTNHCDSAEDVSRESMKEHHAAHVLHEVVSTSIYSCHTFDKPLSFCCQKDELGLHHLF